MMNQCLMSYTVHVVPGSPHFVLSLTLIQHEATAVLYFLGVFLKVQPQMQISWSRVSTVTVEHTGKYYNYWEVKHSYANNVIANQMLHPTVSPEKTPENPHPCEVLAAQVF